MHAWHVCTGKLSIEYKDSSSSAESSIFPTWWIVQSPLTEWLSNKFASFYRTGYCSRRILINLKIGYRSEFSIKRKINGELICCIFNYCIQISIIMQLMWEVISSIMFITPVGSTCHGNCGVWNYTTDVTVTNPVIYWPEIYVV